MRTTLLTAKLALYAYLIYLLLFLAFSYDPAGPGYQAPVVIVVMDMINLFIHEAGHLFLKLFGMFLYVLGGSLIQVLLPALLLAVTWRQNPGQVGLPAFWTGESLINVSVYVRDAPYRQLKLIARGLIHDWNWLLAGDPDLAEPLADTLFVAGLLLCAAGIGCGIVFAFRAYREDVPVAVSYGKH